MLEVSVYVLLAMTLNWRQLKLEHDSTGQERVKQIIKER